MRGGALVVNAILVQTGRPRLLNGTRLEIEHQHFGLVAALEHQRGLVADLQRVAGAQLPAVDAQAAARHVHIGQPAGRQRQFLALGAVEQACEDARVGVERHGAGHRLGRADQRQLAALAGFGHVDLLVARRDAGAFRQDPDLQEVRGRVLRVVELAVAHAGARGHALDVARHDHAGVGGAGGSVAHAVRMGQSAIEHVADDLHVAMAVGAEALSGRDGVVVEHAQVAEAHVRRVVIVGEREAVMAVEPAMVGMAAVLSLAKREHEFLLSLCQRCR
jgi:hypothetical protein